MERLRSRNPLQGVLRHPAFDCLKNLLLNIREALTNSSTSAPKQLVNSLCANAESRRNVTWGECAIGMKLVNLLTSCWERPNDVVVGLAKFSQNADVERRGRCAGPWHVPGTGTRSMSHATKIAPAIHHRLYQVCILNIV